MDVKDHGIPMVMRRVAGTDGRKIASYQFGDPAQIRRQQYFGRTVLGKQLKAALINRDGTKCAISLERFPAEELQIDHRVPFQVAGDNPIADHEPDDYMLLSASANRAKSWSCEHCKNWIELKDPDVCAGCYWAYPEDYDHVAMREIRRLDLIWQEGEAKEFDSIKLRANAVGKDVPQFVKHVLRKLLRSK